jgi:glutamate racemase
MSKPIGVFDSGVGGLTVLRELNTVLPLESTIYLGDNTRIPYGPLPVEKIRQYTLECLDYLYAEGVKALVIACNTATATTLDMAQKRYDIPVVGVVGSTARAAAETTEGRLGIIATQATVNSGAYVRAINSERPSVEVRQEATPLLTMLVEAGEFDTRKTESVLEGYLYPLRQQKVDTLVLGCTHYPFLRTCIQRLMGGDVRIVECGPPTVASIVALMDEGVLERATDGQPTRRMLTTGNVEAFRRVASTLWPDELPEIEEINVEAEREPVRR